MARKSVKTETVEQVVTTEVESPVVTEPEVATEENTTDNVISEVIETEAPVVELTDIYTDVLPVEPTRVVEEFTLETPPPSEPVDDNLMDLSDIIDTTVKLDDAEVTSTLEESLEVVETQPEEEEEFSEPLVEEELYLSTFEEINEVLTNPEISIIDTMNMLVKSDNVQVKMLVATLLDYNEKMSPIVPTPNERSGASYNYNLYIAMKNVIGSTDEEFYLTGMNIINLVFKELKDDAYNEYLLARFEAGWINSPTSLKSHQYLSTVVSVLCDATTRKENLLKIDFSKLRNDKVLDFNSIEVDRLINFYTN